MSGGGGGVPGGRLYALEEMDEHVIPRAAGVRLTAEDVILLLDADPRPIGGGAALTAQVLLAVRGPLSRSGVEPIVFRRGRGGRPRSAHVELALEQLAFTKCAAVADGSGGQGGGSGIMITAKGRSRIAEKRESLPAAARSALARKRAEWSAAAPVCEMRGATYVHNRKLLERLPPPGEPRSGSGRRGARRAGPDGARSRAAPAPPAGRAPGGRIEECHAEACALAGVGNHIQAVRLFERSILLDPARADGYRGKAESLSALGRREEAARFYEAAGLLEQGRAASARGPEEGGAVAADAAPPHRAGGKTAAAPGDSPPCAARRAPDRGKKRRYPKIEGFPSLVGALLGPPNEDKRVNVLTQFELYRGEQMQQGDGLFASNVIDGLFTNLVYPHVLRALGGQPVLKDFVLYAVQIVMHSDERLNDILINEDVKLDVHCKLTRSGLKDGDAVLVRDIEEIVSITESDRDPDAAAISLLLINGNWLGKFDVIYNRAIVRQKLKRALRFLNDSIRDDNSLEGRYDLLWSGCELLAECMLLLHNMLKPKSPHKQIRESLGQLLRLHNFSYIDEYDEIVQIRESLRYGPPHPDRSREAKKKMAHLQDASMEFAAYAIGFLGGRQAGAGDAGDPAGASGAVGHP